MPKQISTLPVMSVFPSVTEALIGPAGGPFSPTVSEFNITNSGLNVMSWTASCDVNWLDLSATSGSLGLNNSFILSATINDTNANALAEGTHVATLTFTNVTSGIGNCTRTVSIIVTSDSFISPGAGWGGATSEPGQIGSGTAKCIAHWDVVPYQYIAEADTPTFTVGVVAFHIAGIEKVSFGVEGGSFVDVTEMTLNPITGVWEYCATLDLSDFTSDGVVEIRAIAYPKAAAPQANGTGAYPGGGYPRLLESMYLYLDVDTKQTPNVAYCSPLGSDSTGDGTAGNPVKTPFKAAQICHAAGPGGSDASNAIVYMEAGDYDFGVGAGGTTPLTPNGWITMQPAPGVMPHQVRFTTTSATMSISKLRLYNIMIHSYINGGGGSTSERCWFDSCGVSGIDDNDPTTLISSSGWMNGFNAGSYWTDCFGGNDGNTLNPGVHLARNCSFDRCHWACAVFKCVINCSWTNLNAFGSTVHHPDFLHVNFRGSVDTENLIAYGCNGHQISAPGVFFKDSWHIKNVAIVNCAWEGIGAQGSTIGEGTCIDIDHLLLWHVINNTSWGLYYPANKQTNCSYIGTHHWGVGKGPVGGINHNQWDYTNITANWGSLYTPGTNFTVSPDGPMLDSDLRPTSGSPLIGKVPYLVVPIDITGALRTLPTSIGAYN